MQKKLMVFFMLAAMVLYFGNVNLCYAYLDPGTGSMMIQGVLAVIAAAGVSIGVFWKKIKRFFGRHSEQNTDDNNDVHHG